VVVVGLAVSDLLIHMKRGKQISELDERLDLMSIKMEALRSIMAMATAAEEEEGEEEEGEEEEEEAERGSTMRRRLRRRRQGGHN
jgi:Ran GTPase-activating protein (RanGAP) involved in mRNA processing and transport